MSLSGMVEIPRPFDPSARLRTFRTCSRRSEYPSCRPFDVAQDKLRRASRCPTASVIPLENGIQVNGMGMVPGFHRGDDKAGMTGIIADFQSTNSEPLGFESRVV